MKTTITPEIAFSELKKEFGEHVTINDKKLFHVDKEAFSREDVIGVLMGFNMDYAVESDGTPLKVRLIPMSETDFYFA